jgi:glycosyltransferase involved in cell wall biosynthesis
MRFNLKILHVINSLKRKGPVNVLYNLVKYHVKDGHKIYIIAINDKESKSRYQEFVNLGVEIINFHLGYKSYYKLSNLVKQRLAEVKPDILQANCFFSEWALAKISHKHKLSLIHNYPKDDFKSKFGPMLGSFMQYISYRSWKRFNFLLTVSKANSVAIEALYKVSVDYIYNGIELVEQKYEKKVNNSLKNKMNFDTDAKVFIYADSMIKRKDPETVVKGFLEFSISNKKCILLLAGNGELLSHLKDKYSSHTDIIFLGHVDNIDDYYSISNFYITSSLAESFHLSVLEALLHDLPVVCSNIPCHEFFLKLNENIGFLFKKGDSNSLASALKEVVILKERTTLISKKILLEKKLTAELMADEYIKYYKDMLNG